MASFPKNLIGSIHSYLMTYEGGPTMLQHSLQDLAVAFIGQLLIGMLLSGIVYAKLYGKKTKAEYEANPGLRPEGANARRDIALTYLLQNGALALVFIMLYSAVSSVPEFQGAGGGAFLGFLIWLGFIAPWLLTIRLYIYYPRTFVNMNLLYGFLYGTISGGTIGFILS